MAQQTVTNNHTLTAVDYLVNLYYTEYDILLPSEDFAKAKQMEKEQIMNARLSTFDLLRRNDVLEAEQYYNETYGENKD